MIDCVKFGCDIALQARVDLLEQQGVTRKHADRQPNGLFCGVRCHFAAVCGNTYHARALAKCFGQG